MNHFNKLLLGISIAIAASSAPVNAATLYFAPDTPNAGTGSIDVVLPMDNMGTLPVPRGRIKINGNTAELSTIREWQFDRDNVLQGTVLDTRVDLTGKQPYVRGVIFWTEGPWIEYFDEHKPDETVISNGVSIVGRITEVTDSDIAIDVAGTIKRAPLAAVSEVRSPRVFSFAIPSTSMQQRPGTQSVYYDARSISMVATSKPFRLAALKSTIVRQQDDGDWSTKKCIAVGTVLSIVELSQLVPTIAVPLGVGPNYEHQLRVRSLSVLRGNP